jgi:hypothetical protein
MIPINFTNNELNTLISNGHVTIIRYSDTPTPEYEAGMTAENLIISKVAVSISNDQYLHEVTLAFHNDESN